MQLAEQTMSTCAQGASIDNLISKLREINQSDIARGDSVCNTFLGEEESPAIKPKQLALLNEIREDAKQLFGSNIAIARKQEERMIQCGFPVKWRQGMIVTEKGMIRY